MVKRGYLTTAAWTVIFPRKNSEEFWTEDIIYQSCESLETDAVAQHINCTLNKSQLFCRGPNLKTRKSHPQENSGPYRLFYL